MSQPTFVFASAAVSYTVAGILYSNIEDEDGYRKMAGYLVWFAVIALYAVGSYLAMTELNKWSNDKLDLDDDGDYSDCLGYTCGWMNLPSYRLEEYLRDYTYLYSGVLLIFTVSHIFGVTAMKSNAIKDRILNIAMQTAVLAGLGLQLAIIFVVSRWWHALFLIPLIAMVSYSLMVASFDLATGKDRSSRLPRDLY